MPTFEVDYEATAIVDAVDKEDAEFLVSEDLRLVLPDPFEITEVREVNAVA